MRPLPLLALVAALTGCASPPPAPKAQTEPARTPHAAPDLKPRMRRMQANLQHLREALATGDIENAKRHAGMLAHAVPPPRDGTPLPGEWGPDYLLHHDAFHQRAAAFRDALEGADPETRARLYLELANQCQACHDQSPMGKLVDLSGLLIAPGAE